MATIIRYGIPAMRRYTLRSQEVIVQRVNGSAINSAGIYVGQQGP